MLTRLTGFFLLWAFLGSELVAYEADTEETRKSSLGSARPASSLLDEPLSPLSSLDHPPLSAKRVRLVDLVRGANADFLAQNFAQAQIQYCFAHRQLEAYSVGQHEVIDISGTITFQEAGLAVFFADKDDPEIKSSAISIGAARSFEKLQNKPLEAEWYGIAAWHLHSFDSTLLTAFRLHYVAARKYMACDRPDYYLAIAQIKSAVLMLEYASNLSTPSHPLTPLTESVLKVAIRQGFFEKVDFAHFCTHQATLLRCTYPHHSVEFAAQAHLYNKLITPS